MNKRKFGMSTLKVEQGRFESYSHWNNAYDLIGQDGGKEWIKAHTSMKVIGVHKFNKSDLTGFFNTVHFYDRENDVTLALTHMDNVDDYYVGKVFAEGENMYEEGTAGKEKNPMDINELMLSIMEYEDGHKWIPRTVIQLMYNEEGR